MPSDHEQLFLAQLPLIERLVAFTCRRQRFSAEEAEEFDSEVKLRLVDDDYAVLRKFEGTSSLSTYLTVVLQRLAIDFRRKRWGKWRPSAAAKRRGATALRLEELVWKDGFSQQEAFTLLRQRYGVTAGDEELEELVAQLPQRTSRRGEEIENEELPEPIADEANPEELLFATEERQQQSRALSLLEECLGELDGTDRLILRLRFDGDFTIADIARTLGLEQRRLYRTLPRLLEQLRVALEARGLGAEIATLLPPNSISRINNGRGK